MREHKDSQNDQSEAYMQFVNCHKAIRVRGSKEAEGRGAEEGMS